MLLADPVVVVDDPQVLMDLARLSVGLLQQATLAGHRYPPAYEETLKVSPHDIATTAAGGVIG